VLDVYMCPHHPQGTDPEYSKRCDCRKPKPGMILNAQLEHNINIKKSILIGDKLTDIQAGYSAGIPNCFLLKSKYLVDKALTESVFENWDTLMQAITHGEVTIK